MKSISSYGGPYIAIQEVYSHEWGGVERSTFADVLPSDYEAAGALLDSDAGKSTLVAAVLRGARNDALVLATPVETVLLKNPGKVIILQFHYRDDDFDFASIGDDWCQRLGKSETVSFECVSPGRYLVFDGACLRDDVGDNYLTFDLQPGRHLMTSGLLEPDDRTLVSLICIQPDRDTPLLLADD